MLVKLECCVEQGDVDPVATPVAGPTMQGRENANHRVESADLVDDRAERARTRSVRVTRQVGEPGHRLRRGGERRPVAVG